MLLKPMSWDVTDVTIQAKSNRKLVVGCAVRQAGPGRGDLVREICTQWEANCTLRHIDPAVSHTLDINRHANDIDVPTMSKKTIYIVWWLSRGYKQRERTDKTDFNCTGFWKRHRIYTASRRNIVAEQSIKIHPPINNLASHLDGLYLSISVLA